MKPGTCIICIAIIEACVIAGNSVLSQSASVVAATDASGGGGAADTVHSVRGTLIEVDLVASVLGVVTSSGKNVCVFVDTSTIIGSGLLLSDLEENSSATVMYRTEKQGNVALRIFTAEETVTIDSPVNVIIPGHAASEKSGTDLRGTREK
jgi:hypothetical protein